MIIDFIEKEMKRIKKNGEGFWNWNELVLDGKVVDNVADAKKLYKKTKNEEILAYIEDATRAGKQIYAELKSLLNFIRKRDIQGAYYTILRISDIEKDFNDDPLAQNLFDLLVDHFDLYTSDEFSVTKESAIGSYLKFIKLIRPIVKDWWKEEDPNSRPPFDEYFSEIIKEKIHPLKKMIRKNLLFI